MGRARGRLLYALALAGCTASGTARDQLVELRPRIEDLNDRLATLTVAADDAIAKVQRIAAWTTERPPELAAAELRRARMEERRREREARALARERRRRGHVESGELLDPFATADELPPSDREIEGATAAITCASETECTIDRAFVTKLRDEPSLLERQARIVSSNKDGVLRGYKLYGIRRGSLPKLLGCKNGDLITAVGGKKATASWSGVDFLGELATAKKPLRIDVLRKGMPITFKITVR